jgi:DNA-binding response OmpR family regulator
VDALFVTTVLAPYRAAIVALLKLKYSITIARTAAEAHSLSKYANYDLILVGADHVGGDLEHLSQRTSALARSASVVVLTDRAAVKEHLLRLGTVQIVAWPCSDERLARVIMAARHAKGSEVSNG